MNKSSELYRHRINAVIDYIDNNIHHCISLENLAAVACFSPFHFHRIFVAVTGETVSNFTNRLRNEKVARLLTFSRQPVGAIAASCGFSSSATLSRQFKQYFGISPSAYRNGAAINNSKIGKDWYDGSHYPCTMSEDALTNAFPVTVRQFPERKIAYIRVIDAFREGLVLHAFTTLVTWAKTMGIFDSQTIFGMSIDDPAVTPKEKYRYEACITIPKQMVVTYDGVIQTTILPNCKYAVTAVSGDFNMVVAATNYLFDSWLINSSYECEAQHALEVFMKKENVCNWKHFDLELCIPVRSIKA